MKEEDDEHHDDVTIIAVAKPNVKDEEGKASSAEWVQKMTEYLRLYIINEVNDN